MNVRGPWKIDFETEKGTIISDKDGVFICFVYGDVGREIAQLIAASPELQKACEMFVSKREVSIQLKRDDAIVRYTRAAIAKSRGE